VFCGGAGSDGVEVQGHRSGDPPAMPKRARATNPSPFKRESRHRGDQEQSLLTVVQSLHGRTNSERASAYCLVGKATVWRFR
jgi:hypothetical protein